MRNSANSSGRTFVLPRSRILRGRSSIQLLFRKGRVVRQRHLDLRYILFPGWDGICLAGFIAGKRIGKAHERNLIRRRMREAYRQHQHLVRSITETVPVGFHGIFIAKKTGVPFRVVEQECMQLLTVVRQKIDETQIHQP